MSQLATAGRLLIAPFAGVARWYNRTAQSHPFTVGVITTGLKTSAADVFAQKVRCPDCSSASAPSGQKWTRHLASTVHAVRTACMQPRICPATGISQPPPPLYPCPCRQVVEKREDFDWTRHAAFCAFGFAYLGGFQYWL